jgi:hypothetical protein
VPSPRVIPGQRQHAAHYADCSGRVIDSCDCQHLRNHLDSIAFLTYQMGLGALEQQLGSWKLLRAQLVLQSNDLHAVQPSILVLNRDEEE